MKVNAVILAAGKGSRMKSELPKVLHSVANKPMLAHVLDAAKASSAEKICVVYGHGGGQVQARFADDDSLRWCEQKELLGTGHAVMQALPQLDPESIVLCLVGDTPLIQAETLVNLLSQCDANTVGLVTAEPSNPFGYGRIIRDDQNKVVGVVEEKDTNAEQKRITEINTGILAVPAKLLSKWLPQLKNNNAQGEYYLPDIIPMAVAEGIPVNTVSPQQFMEVEGVNTRLQLAAIERFYQQQQAQKLMLNGVTLLDPARIDVRGELSVGTDITVDINTIFEGAVTIGSHTTIGANCILINSNIGDNVTIKANSIIEDSVIENECQVGPFARIRPQTLMKVGARVGNFVETKKSVIGAGSKVNHLTYIGDADIGSSVNIGAGTITCNYDGVNKHKTVIKDGAFIGSNSSLVAPVVIGENATIGAGSTIGKDAPDNELTLTRTKQSSISSWKRPTKKD